jgi:hypothetical protein
LVLLVSTVSSLGLAVAIQTSTALAISSSPLLVVSLLVVLLTVLARSLVAVAVLLAKAEVVLEISSPEAS